jgi:hypothetical protein
MSVNLGPYRSAQSPSTSLVNRKLCIADLGLREEHFGLQGHCESATEFGNVANAWIKCRSVVLRDRRLGEPRHRLTVTKHCSVGVAFMKVIGEQQRVVSCFDQTT